MPKRKGIFVRRRRRYYSVRYQNDIRAIRRKHTRWTYAQARAAYRVARRPGTNRNRQPRKDIVRRAKLPKRISPIAGIPLLDSVPAELQSSDPTFSAWYKKTVTWADLPDYEKVYAYVCLHHTLRRTDVYTFKDVENTEEAPGILKYGPVTHAEAAALTREGILEWFGVGFPFMETSAERIIGLVGFKAHDA